MSDWIACEYNKLVPVSKDHRHALNKRYSTGKGMKGEDSKQRSNIFVLETQAHAMHTGNDNDATETAASVLDDAVQAFFDALCNGLQRAGLHPQVLAELAHSISSRLLAGDVEALLQATLEHPENKR